MLVEITWRDLKLAFRGFRKAPGFFLMVILTLGLGSGAVTAVFGMANQLVFRPLSGVANTSEAGFMRFRGPNDPDCCPQSNLSLPDMLELKRSATLLDGIASYASLTVTLSTAGERPVFVSGSTVYGDFFEVLGVQPTRGRLLRADETGVDADPFLVVISERLWASHFGRDVDPVGRTLILDEQAFTVLGVAGGGFAGLDRSQMNDLWFPHSALMALFGRTRESLVNPESPNHRAFVALPVPGTSPEAVEAQVADVIARLGEGASDHQRYLAALQPILYPGLHTNAFSRDETQSSLTIFGGLGAIALLISCANVVSLLLVRNTAAATPVAIRRAIGASRGRIAWQCLMESILLGLLGTVVGLGVAGLTLSVFRGLSISNVALEPFSLDWRVLAFAATLTVSATVVFGGLPALLAGRFDLETALRDGGRATRRHSPISVGLLAGQMALTFTLIVGAALLTQTLRNLYTADLGLSLDRISELVVQPPDALPPAEFAALGNRLASSVAAVPGVEGAAVSTQPPYVGSAQFINAISPAEMSGGDPPSHLLFGVTPGWFEFFGVEAVRGRTLQRDDLLGSSPPPVVLTAALSRALYGDIDVVGRRVLVGRGSRAAPEEFEVVGIVNDIYAAEAPTEPRQAYFLILGAGGSTGTLRVFARTRDSESGLAEEIQTAVGATLPDQPLEDPVPVSAAIDDVRHDQIALGRLLTLLSVLTILLSAVGLYGVVWYDVTSRTREFAVRSALGAPRRHLARIVAHYTGIILLLGSALGLLGSYALSQVLESRLFGVAPLDPASYAVGLVVLGIAAVLATAGPTATASRIDPATVLRND